MNAARRAIEILNKSGWCQGRMEATDGRVCLIEALHQAKASREEWAVVRDVIAEQYPDARVHGGVSVGSWNDDPDRRPAEVRSVLEKAAVLLEEQA